VSGAELQLSTSRWPELADRRLVVLLPLGSCEQHGPHLPLDTDTRIALAVALSAARDRSARSDGVAGDAAVAVAPPLAYGASGEHAGFAGTLSMGTEALATVLIELARSAGPEVAAIVVVNGHGGNRQAVNRAVEVARAEGRSLHAWWPELPAGGDHHAGRTETSVLLALAPETVAMERAAPGNPSPIGSLLPIMRRHGVRAVSPTGVLGDPNGASATEGRRLLDAWRDDLLAHLSRLARDG
jgi:creatinine amidohydrolase